jgi:enediyne biosynthesis protein E4
MRAACVLLIAASPVAAGPLFVDRSHGFPVAHVYSGGWEHFVGGGVAALDCDGSGRPSLFVAGGENPARLLVNATAAPGAPIRFTLGEITEITGVTGAYPLDVDGDGVMDLAVLRVGPNLLLRGLGDCRFEDASADWGFHGGDGWSTAFAATWEPGAEWPTLAIGNYVDRANPAGPFMACDANELHRPDLKAGGRGYVAPIRLEPGYCALSMLISDWQRVGRPDLRISNDRHYYVRDGHEEMWRLDQLRPLDDADGWARVSLWGMGIASRDITGNGLPDVMLTSMGDQLVQLNEGEGLLRNAPYTLGTYATTPWFGDDGRPSTGWHAEWADFDNDGRADLFIAKGNVDQMPSNAMRDPNNLLMQQADGKFAEKADVAGVATTHRARGAAVVDLNGDGRLDIVVVNRRAGLEVWENATEGTGNWLRVVPRMDGPNSHAVGAWVEVRTAENVQVQEVTVGGGHVSGQAMGLHFGLGAAEGAEVRVIWPGGATSDWVAVVSGRAVQVWPDGDGLRIVE